MKYLKQILNVIIPILFLTIVWLFLPKFLKLFSPLFIGFIMSLIFVPIVTYLEKKLKINKTIGSAIIVLSLLSVIFFSIYTLVKEFIVFLPNLIEYSQEIIVYINTSFELSTEINTLLQNSLSNLSNYVGKIIALSSSLVSSTPIIIVNSFIIILSSYFFTIEHEEFYSFVFKLIPSSLKNKTEQIIQEIKKLINSYFVAQIKITLIIFLVIFVGLLILRVEHVFLLSILIAIFDFLPLFGAGAIIIPWGIFSLVTNNYTLGIGLLIIYAATQIVRQIIQPKILGDTVGISSLTSLIFMYIGFVVSGISGMILAVPIGVFFINITKLGFFDKPLKNAQDLIVELKMFLEDDKK